MVQNRTSAEKEKARYMTQGNKDRVKLYMVHETETPRASYVPLIMSVSAVKGFITFSHDVNQEYIQSKDKLLCQIFFLPKNEDCEILGMSENKLFELARPLYGILDAGDY